LNRRSKEEGKGKGKGKNLRSFEEGTPAPLGNIGEREGGSFPELLAPGSHKREERILARRKKVIVE